MYSKKIITAALAVVGLNTVVSSAANAAVYTVNAASDVTAYRNNSSGPYVGALSPTDGYIRVFGRDQVDTGIFEYSLAGLTAADIVNSATARFYLQGTVVNGAVNLFGFAGSGIASFGEANAPSQLVGSMMINGNGLYDVALSSSYLQGLIGSGAQYLGIKMVSTSTGGFGPGGDFCATDGNAFCLSTQRPSLTVNFAEGQGAVPEPATWAMLILGFGTVGGAMRRRSATAKASRMKLTYA